MVQFSLRPHAESSIALIARERPHEIRHSGMVESIPFGMSKFHPDAPTLHGAPENSLMNDSSGLVGETGTTAQNVELLYHFGTSGL